MLDESNKLSETAVYKKPNGKRLNIRPNVQVGGIRSKSLSIVIESLSAMDASFV